MQPFKYLPAFASLLAIAGAAPAIAQTQNLPWVQMETMSVNAGIGGQTGDGLLHLPNLGTNCAVTRSRSRGSAQASKSASQR
jgi:hypothetical protein